MKRALFLSLLLSSSAHAAAQDVVDAGVDAGDAGDVDAGEVDAGEVDAGEVDAGDVDAGLPLGEHDETASEDELPEALRPTVEYRIEPADGIMTGDLVHAILVVTLQNEDDDVAVPRQDFGDLELHDQRHTDRRVDGHRVFTFELDFLTLAPGEYEIAPITLRVVTESGVIGTVHTEARTITVGSLTANEPDAQPRPATDPVVVMEDDYTLAYVLGFLGAMLLSALLGWLLSRWWRARPKVAPPPPPPRPPAEIALEKLRALRRRVRSAVEEGREAEIVDGASDALREYLGARFDFNGLESTTDEVVGRLRSARLGPISINEIIALLGDADLVKFAKAAPDEAQCERMLEGAERIVRGTVPSATAVTPPAKRREIDQTGPNRAERGDKAEAEAPTATSTTPTSTSTASDTATDGAWQGARNAEGERVDHLGRRIPDTNPPPPPKPEAEANAERTEPIKTLLGTADGPEATPEPAADLERKTPVGFSDPRLADARVATEPTKTEDPEKGGKP